MASPLAFTDLYGFEHEEPSVTAQTDIQTIEPARVVGPPNDLIVLSPFRSGKPRVLSARLRSQAATRNLHDPDRNNDQGVALIAVARSAFADQNVNGAADVRTVRVDNATNAKVQLMASATALVEIATADYGAHTNRARAIVEDGTTEGKKLTLTDGVRVFEGDNLGSLFTLQYVGNGSAAAATVVQGTGRVAYTGQPADADKITINGKVFEFESTGGVTGGNIAVTIGGTNDATFENLRQAILANVNGVASATLNTATNVLTIVAPEVGVTIAETLDSGNAFSVSNAFPASRLVITLTGASDGSTSLDIPLTTAGFKSLDQLVNYLNAQVGYVASISPYANKFIPSSGLDAVAALDIKTTAKTFTGYSAAIVDWVTHRTRGNYTATELARSEPDETTYAFTGGTTPGVVVGDWEAALNEVGAGIERGGVLLVNTDDPAVHAMVMAFIVEQRAAGKWFRAYTGLPPATTVAAALQRTGALDHSRMRVTMQRPGVFGTNGTVEYLHPVFLAAALAGGACGNLPYVNPLTNKRLRFAAIHEDDSFDLPTRASLLAGGVTVVKREEDRTVVALHVSTSRDPDKRMTRIASEIDTVDTIEQALREAFLSFRGKWAGVDIGARVYSVGARVMNRFVREGAITAGVDEANNPMPAWRWVGTGFDYNAGVLKLDLQFFIGGELNHISIHGAAEYQRIVGELGGGGGVQNLTAQIPAR